MAESKKPSQPRSAVDAAARDDKGYVSPLARQTATFADSESELNKNGYVGVDPIYQNAANKTDEPTQKKSSNGSSGQAASKTASSSK